MWKKIHSVWDEILANNIHTLIKANQRENKKLDRILKQVTIYRRIRIGLNLYQPIDSISMWSLIIANWLMNPSKHSAPPPPPSASTTYLESKQFVYCSTDQSRQKWLLYSNHIYHEIFVIVSGHNLTKRWTNVGLMLACRLPRWPNIHPTLVQRHVPAVMHYAARFADGWHSKRWSGVGWMLA